MPFWHIHLEPAYITVIAGSVPLTVEKQSFSQQIQCEICFSLCSIRIKMRYIID